MVINCAWLTYQLFMFVERDNLLRKRINSMKNNTYFLKRYNIFSEKLFLNKLSLVTEKQGIILIKQNLLYSE
jgi:hypothetical protein